ncbi:TPA: aldehyde dehydrogenase family protein [Escherichia coli]|nr:aldehyde dehydrogenase family protein [Escherichia coli]EFF9609315.1 aldehyde dehydrogenase family protein [Escherichia coli]HAI4957278.1 aldehyde dehydrogenase family protein [Escherichia coli]HAN6723086.1 aldehyde dehydrogenase family protein [Escherichia coli]
MVNPATEAVISRIPDGQAEDARKAIDAAERAQPEWEALPAIERASWLRKISAGIRERASEISALIVEEGGKIQQLAEVEVAFTADYIDYMAEWARRYEGEIIQSDRPGENILLFKRALGVTTGILPWNFPFFLIARKMAPALLTGNTIVIKPSEFTPNNAIAFAKIVDEIGLPRGVFNLVLGRGETVGQELAGNPKVAMVSMTGSVSAGEKIMATAAKNITKVCLELGGTQNLNVAMKAIKGLKFGETYINRENFEAMQGFHAGWRKSGIGGADGKHGLHEYLQTQVVYLQS